MKASLAAACVLFAVSASGAARAAGPCGLASADEVSGVVGSKVVEVKPAGLPQPACAYVLKQGKFYLYHIADGRSGFLAGRKYQDANARTVAGIGDDAYWSPSIRTLNVLRGNDYMMFQFIGSRNENADFDAAKALAAKVLPRL